MADSKKTTTTTTNWQRCEATQNAYTVLVGVSPSKSSLENCFAVSTKTKHSRALWSKILTRTQQKWVNMCKKKTKMFVFGVAPTWKPPRCSSTEWVSKRWRSHTRGHHAAESKRWLRATIQMSRNIMLSEWSRHKREHTVGFHLYQVQNRSTVAGQWLSSVAVVIARGWRVRGLLGAAGNILFLKRGAGKHIWPSPSGVEEPGRKRWSIQPRNGNSAGALPCSSNKSPLWSHPGWLSLHKGHSHSRWAAAGECLTEPRGPAGCALAQSVHVGAPRV